MKRMGINDRMYGSPLSRGLAGFTILELTVVLAVIAAVMGGMISLMSASLEGRSYNGTAAKLKTLQQALADYRIAYNKLPCPADSTLAVSNVAFGVALASPCTGADSVSAVVAIGMVPTRTLGLPDDMAVDSWGRRIRYAVAPTYVVDDAFDGATSTAGASLTRLVVNNNENNTSNAALPNVTTTALFVLVSYGKDGHGGYTGALNGSAASTRVNGGITNTNQLLNCKCTSAAAVNFSPSVNNKVFVQGEEKIDSTTALKNFDDIVVFSTRADLRDATE